MYRSDKQFMKNPATAAMRIYIGNLADSVVPENLEERFKQHGHILGMHAQKGFAFIQYETAEQASRAIDVEHGSAFHNRKINVKHANVDKRPGGGPGGPPVGGGGDQRGNQRVSFGEPMNRSMNESLHSGGGDSGDFGPPPHMQGGPGPNRGLNKPMDQSGPNMNDRGPMGGPNIQGGLLGRGPMNDGPNMGRGPINDSPVVRIGDRDQGAPNMGRGPMNDGPGGRMGDREQGGPNMGRGLLNDGPNMGRGGMIDGPGGRIGDRDQGAPNMGRGPMNDGPAGRKGDRDQGGPNMGRGPMNEGPGVRMGDRDQSGPNMGRGPLNDGPGGRMGDRDQGGPNIGRGPSNDGPNVGRTLMNDGPGARMGDRDQGGPNMGRGLLNDSSNMGRAAINDGPGCRIGDRDQGGPNMGRGSMIDGPGGRMGDRDPSGGPGNRQGGPAPDRGDRGNRDRDRDDFDNRNKFGGGGRNRGRGVGRGKPYNSRDRGGGRDRENFGRGDDIFDNFENFGPRSGDNNRSGPRGGGPMGGGPRGGPPMGPEGPMDVGPMGGPGFPGVPPIAAKLPGPPDRAERNDCEIIVVSKLLTVYAEYIEQRLKSMGLVVDLLYPNEDVPIGRVLANISSRGCLFAILVMPQNEENRSLTLNVLHGIPQEHRNMPLEDSLVLITRNFDAYMRGETVPATDDEDTKKLSDRHPDQVQTVFNLLAENRQLSSGQYDRVIKYLEERKELQMQFELTEGIESDLVEPEVKNKRAELQSRIMNILNKTDEPPPITNPLKVDTLASATTTSTAAPTTGGGGGDKSGASASGPTPLLNDPSVQKALDSILLGDMFKGLTGAI